MKYDITTSHMNTQHWIVKAESKDHAEEIFKKAQITWSKERRMYVLPEDSAKYPVYEDLVTIPDAELRAVNVVPGQSEPTFTKLGESNE